jgi:tetratricopeptide (TPR) repeat protein
MDSRVDVRAGIQKHVSRVLALAVFFFSAQHYAIFAQEDALQHGLIALQEGHFEQALEALTIAEREQPEDPRIRSFRGIALAQTGKTAEAEVEYREAARLDPKYADAWKNLGFLLWTEHRLEQAREALSQAIALSPGDPFSHYYLGRVQLDSQQYTDAFRELKLSGMRLPESATFLLQLANGHVALGETEEAHKTLQLIAAQRLSPLQSAQAASLFLAVREYEAAIKLLKTAIQLGPPEDVAWAYGDLALVYLIEGNYEQAVQQSQTFVNLQQARKSAAGEASAAWSLLGISEARAGRSDAAIRDLRRATALEPGNEQHWLNLTLEMMEAGQFGDAIAVTQEGIAANPKSYALHLRLGAAQLATGKYKDAEAAFRTLADAGDPLPTSYVGLAQVLLREGRADEAARVVEAAEKKIGKSFLLSYFLGLSLERAGKRLEAADAFRQAIALNAESSEAHLELGKAELALGQVREAIAELQEALRLSPGNVQARRLLSQAYRRAGDTQRAEEFAKVASEKPPAAEGDLLGDFLLPKWRLPEEGAHE